ncbi:MAG: hypothetical protein HYR84_13285 [Planctomycetes bacterium]|nr:hypothetical protein [Planctomycetota bacterium]
MPSRIVTAAIVLFWLVMTGWLIYREVVPLMLADASPTYTPDLTDEIGSPQVDWKILRNGKRAGRATSQVISNDDRTYTFKSTYRFRQFVIGLAEIRNMELVYKITDAGKLQFLATKVTGDFTLGLEILGKGDTTIELKGQVVDDIFSPRLFINQVEEKLPEGSDVRFEQTGNIVNPMHLLNRLRGLRDGQTWKITMLDPLQGFKKQLPGAFAKQMGVASLIATVSVVTFEWDHREVACYMIEYREPGKDDVVASTWARKADGLVLQQKSSQMGIDLVLQRSP